MKSKKFLINIKNIKYNCNNSKFIKKKAMI